ncbi:PREDICTED: uncharacterized protein LOC109320828 [Crocodylus porosus]|uniref:uncharacterized protein LOC109320828 n=1 Tax=Crocodylus porosus TaxID=8502 RepID=UPI00093FEA23|nr:PREDICTED: uncharacterized protein LOC109320828 [Crocodylus porosus]
MGLYPFKFCPKPSLSFLSFTGPEAGSAMGCWLVRLFSLCLGLGVASLPCLDYPIALYSGVSCLSTALRLRPAFCLYEQWLQASVDPSEAPRASATIEVQVQPTGDNATYKVPCKFPVPPCSPLHQEPMAPREFTYNMGPSLECLNDTCSLGVLPGRSYRVRYVLYNHAMAQVAITNWSQPFETRGLPQSFYDIDPSPGEHSGGMVVLTVLLSLSVVLLLTAMGLTFLWGCP